MAISQELRDAFKWRLHNPSYVNGRYCFLSPWPRVNTNERTLTQWALDVARADVANRLRRYPRNYVAQLGAPFEHGGFTLQWCERPTDIGLRFVGYASDITKSNTTGYYTDSDYSETMRGVVYQLPGRNRKPRFVAGHDNSDNGAADNAGPAAIDLTTIYEGEAPKLVTHKGYAPYMSYETNPADHDGCRDAAHAADQIAEKCAESEREYQTAWAAGSLYANACEEIATLRKATLATIAAMKANCATLRALPSVIRDRIKESIESDLSERSDLFAKMEKLASGDYGELYFWQGDKRLKEAFNEGAGRPVLA